MRRTIPGDLERFPIEWQSSPLICHPSITTVTYLSLYRKYRSQTFSDLIGQDHVVRTLQNAISSSRIAHSYLFTGPRGTGKTSTARLLAKALCCENGPSAEPDDTCEICRAITSGSCVDVIEMDAASESGVDEIRQQIVESIEYRPMMCRYKIFIIDEVHDLSAKAFDALLKTVEEPPPHAIFILATTEYNKVPPTIRSRCQKFEFHRASMQNLVSRLNYVCEQEGVEAEPAAVSAISRMADGGYRDALTLLEQAILTSDGKITLRQVYDQLGLVSEEVVDAIVLAMKDGNVPAITDRLAEVARLGRDPRSLLESMMYRLADLTRASYEIALEAGAESTREAALYETASRIGRDTILRLRGQLAEAHKTIRDISLPRVWLEAELIRLSMPLASLPTQTPPPASPPIPAPTAPRPTPPPRQAEESRQQKETASKEAVRKVVPPDAGGGPPSGTDTWSKTVVELTALSKTLGLKLADTAAKMHNGKLIVELGPQVHDWVIGNGKVRTAITEAVQRNFGASTEVEYAVRKKEGGPEEPNAVELPAEGSKLEQLARQIFGEDKPAKKAKSSNRDELPSDNQE